MIRHPRILHMRMNIPTAKSAASAALASPSGPGLRVAARTFSIVPAIGDPTAGRTGAGLLEVVGDLKGTVFLFDDGSTRLCLVTSSAHTDVDEMKAAIESAMGEILGLKPGEIVASSSHNHCVPLFVENGSQCWMIEPGAPAGRGRLNRVGILFMEALRRAAAELPALLKPVTVEWAVGKESRVTYNRRGRRADGKTYFIREEDRVQLEEGYVGQIDPDATVVLFRGRDGKPVACLAHFTGHPVTAYNPEHPVSFGEWPQVACERLSAQLGGIPTGFCQGCTGDINSKYMLSGTVEQSRQLGEYLGSSFVQALGSLRRCRY